MTVQINDTLRASARLEFDGIDDMVNVYDFALGTPGPLDDQEAVDDILEILEDLYTIIRLTMTVLVFFRDIRIVNLTQDRLLGTHAWPNLTLGALAEDAVPPGVCGLVNFNTDRARVTLRKYYGAMTITSLDEDGTFTTAYTTVLSNVAAFLLSVQSPANGDWLYGTHKDVITGMVWPLAATVTDIPAYQRRRKQGRGS